MKRHVRGFKYLLRFIFVFVFVFISTLLSLRPILCNPYSVFSFCSIPQWGHFPISEALHGSAPPVVLGIVPQPDPHRSLIPSALPPPKPSKSTPTERYCCGGAWRRCCRGKGGGGASPVELEA